MSDVRHSNYRLLLRNSSSLLFDLAIEVDDVQHQQAVDDENSGRAKGGIRWYSMLATHERVNGSSEKPELHYNADSYQHQQCCRSEEGRVGKECRSRWSPD